MIPPIPCRLQGRSFTPTKAARRGDNDSASAGTAAPARDRSIDFLQQRQSPLNIPVSSSGMKARFGIELRKRHARPFFHQFIEADAEALGEAS